MFCPHCGAENARANRFCGQCGTGIAAPPRFAPAPVPNPGLPVAEAERRQLSVMFADLVGSTALGMRLDPEDLREAMDAWRSCVAAIVVRYTGLVIRLMGDGVLAVFGFPRTHETDTEQAVRAGLAIIEAVRRLDTLAGPPGTLSTRVGVATGLVIAGDLIGAGPSLEWSMVGETPNLAARLQALAEPNMLAIDDPTRQLVGGMVEYANLGRRQLKGFPSPVQTWSVLRESGIESRYLALRGTRLPLIDRAEEKALLQHRWTAAQGGKGQAVLLVGEPGVGKSRLVADFEEQIDNGAARVLFACSPHYQDTPLFPVIRYFEAAAGFRRDDPPARKLGKLRALLEGTSSFDAEEIGLLADLLSASTPSDAAARLTPQRGKERTFRAVLHYIEALAGKAPLLAVVEDLHWADPTSTELIEALIGRLEGIAALLIVSTRPQHALSCPSSAWVTVRMLGGLDGGDSRHLIRQVAGAHELADEVVTRFIERAAGVPLFLEEITRSVVNSATAAQREDRRAPGSTVAVDSIPASLNALLAARLDQLGPGKEVAQASSVIGRECSLEMLRTVSALSADRLRQAVGELMQAGLVAPARDGRGAIFVFHHTLIQEVAYASMLRGRRRLIHLRYAEALERDPTGPAAAAPELLAAHFGRAGVAEKSIDYYLKAAQRATGRFALAEIVGYLRKGLDQIGGLPVTASILRKELILRIELGRALMEHRGAGDEEVRSNMERAQALCIDLGETEKLLQVHDGLSNHHFARSQFDKLLECAEQALELGNRVGNPQAVVVARRTSGYARLVLGRFHEAREDFAQALAGYGGAMATTRDPKVSVCAGLGLCLTALGAGLRHRGKPRGRAPCRGAKGPSGDK